MYTQDFEGASQKRFQIQDTWTSLESFEVSGIGSQSQQESLSISLNLSWSLLRSGFSSKLDIIWYQFLCMNSHCGYFYHAQRSMMESCYQKVSENLSWVTIWWKTIAVLVKALPGLKLKNSSEWAPEKLYFLGLFIMERKTGVLGQKVAVATAAKLKLWTEKLDTLLGLPFWRNSCFVSNVRSRNTNRATRGIKVNWTL